MLNLLLIHLLLTLGIFIFPRWLKQRNGIWISAVQLGALVWFLNQLNVVKDQNSARIFLNWIPELGLNFGFILDGLSLTFAILVTGIGALVFLFSHSYMKSYSNTGRFHFFLFLFTWAMLGMVLSSNLIQLFVFWELTTFLSFFLISFYHEKPEARKSAFQALFVTFMGGLGLLAGIILLGSSIDSYSVTDWFEKAEQIRSGKFYLPGLILILLGVFTKSAQFPFHFWLPGAMNAPAPVSAYLHSATMVKAGVFLLARLSPALGGTPEWDLIIPLFGVLTMLVGSYFAITHTDLKAILAYTTINGLGILILLIGIDTSLSIKAAILFLFIHAFYKAALFMIAGFIEKKTGTREIYELGGLWRSFPVTFGVTTLALWSMAGLPPMLGFLGKELIYEAQVHSPVIAILISALGVISNILMFAVSAKILFLVFLGKTKKHFDVSWKKSYLMILGPAVLVLISLLFGLFPGYLADSLLKPAISVVYAYEIEVKLSYWHGINTVFLLSVFTVLSGIVLAWIAIRKRNIMDQWRAVNLKLFPVKLHDIFTRIIESFVALSVKKTKVVQHGYHRYYILTIFLFTLILLWVQLYVTRGWEFKGSLSLNPVYISGIILIIILATLNSIFTHSRIIAIISMGVTGYGISLIYLYFSAVDLAITQVLAETVTIIMFMLILQRLPVFTMLSGIATKIRDFIIALLFGGTMTVLALKSISLDFNTPVSNYFLEKSFTEAFGRNVVNVILVDFRALDTMGEVTVLVIAALGVALLLKSGRKKA